MEGLLREISHLGNMCVKGGTETIMPFEPYWAQYPEIEVNGGSAHWTYVIES